MYYAGIDYHKRYSVVSIQDEFGKIVLEREVTHNEPHIKGDGPHVSTSDK
jgi:hypothetical protein